MAQCGAWEYKEECEFNSCYWDGYANDCLNSQVYCNDVYDTYGCGETTGCEWDYTYDICVEDGMAQCGAWEYKEECEFNSCYWDGYANDCLNSQVYCNDVYDTYGCGETTGCEWDYTYDTCVEDGMALCGAWDYKEDCETNSCWWDGYNYNCENSPVDCSFSFDGYTCGETTGCEWNYTTYSCVEFGTALCGAHEYISECNMNPLCAWIEGACYEISSSSDCWAFEDSGSCNLHTAYCEWFFGEEYCAEFGTAGCAKFNDGMVCEADPTCIWDGNFCMEDMTPPACETYGDDFTCGMAQGCIWAMGICGTMGGAWCDTTYPTTTEDCLSFGTNESACTAAAPGCYFDSEQCVYTNAYNCDMDMSCAWDEFGNSCVEEIGSECGMYYDESSCTQWTTCGWTPSAGQCVGDPMGQPD
jgi:hypothetical protein